MKILGPLFGALVVVIAIVIFTLILAVTVGGLGMLAKLIWGVLLG